MFQRCPPVNVSDSYTLVSFLCIIHNAVISQTINSLTCSEWCHPSCAKLTMVASNGMNAHSIENWLSTKFCLSLINFCIRFVLIHLIPPKAHKLSLKNLPLRSLHIACALFSTALEYQQSFIMVAKKHTPLLPSTSWKSSIKQYLTTYRVIDDLSYSCTQHRKWPFSMATKEESEAWIVIS